ncbi:MAG: hypothetical protein WCU88_02620 [Elusimicrobiota bacterium]|jgi:hypothetical protein
MRNPFCIAAALAVLCACSGPQPRLKVGKTIEGEVIEAVGETTTERSNMEETRKKSLADAQRRAVEMVVGVQLSGKTLVEKAALVESRILARSEGYIRQYDILKQWEEGPLYKTRIRAHVAYQEIANDLRNEGLLKEPQVGNPRVAVLLTESVSGADSDLNAATNGFVQAMLDAGYRVVDRADLMAARAQDVAAEIDKGDTKNVATLGKKLDAEVLIFGAVKANRLEVKQLGDFMSFRATLSAQAYKAQTNEVLMTVSKTESGLDADKDAAVNKALGKVGRSAGEELAASLAKELSRRSFVAVTISGLKSLNELQDAQKALTSVPGVQDLFLRNFAGGFAQMDVRVEGKSAQALASAAETALKAVVKNVTPETVELEMPAQPATQP